MRVEDLIDGGSTTVARVKVLDTFALMQQLGVVPAMPAG